MALATEPKVAGLMPVSMIDWEGKLAAILFLAGCNLRCPYCHNPELVKIGSSAFLPWDQILEQLNEKKGWIDGIVITGGEPTINSDLRSVIFELKALGFLIKVDTNGTKPNIVKELVEERAVDYIALDIKSSFKKYDTVTKIQDQGRQVMKSIEIIMARRIDHEFRTTVVPGFVDFEDAVEIAGHLGRLGAKRYYLQQFNPETVLEQRLEAIKPYPPSFLHKLAESCSKYLPTSVRGAQ